MDPFGTNDLILRTISVILKITLIVSIVYEAYMLKQRRSRRRWWVRPVNLTRDRLGFYEVCTKNLQLSDKEHFFKATRMDPENFNVLLQLLRNRLQRYSKRKAIIPEIRLSLTILYLAQGCNVQVLAWAHKIGISTVRKIIYETCESIWEELHEVYIAPPNHTDWIANANLFYDKSGMPNCLGAIDGKHISIVCPRKSGSLYFNYKRSFSISLLAACDANYTFTFVDIGALGSQSDGGIFLRSAFGKRILYETLEVPPESWLPDGSRKLPYYFVADNAFPLKRNLMRPFPGRNLPADKECFNKHLSKARVHIENAFGILANRWRVLHTKIYACPKNADKIVSAITVLHNFLMLKRDNNYYNAELVDRVENGVEMEGTWRRETAALRSISSTRIRSARAAFALRDDLKEFLIRNNP